MSRKARGTPPKSERPRQGNRGRQQQQEPTATLLWISAHHECSAWLRGAVGQALDRVEAGGLVRGAAGFRFAYLTPYPCLPGSDEERRCDRCRRYFPPGRKELVFFGVRARPNVILGVGLCERCMIREGATRHVPWADGLGGRG